MADITAETLVCACVNYIKRHLGESLKESHTKLKDIKYYTTSSWYSKGLDKCYEYNELCELLYQLQVVILDYQLCLRSIETNTDPQRLDGYIRIIFNPVQQKMNDLMDQIDQLVSNRTDQRYTELKHQLLQLFES